jgi:hypothetical protein
VSPLDTRIPRALQTRTGAALAGRRSLAALFNQFDPNVPVTSTDAGARAIDAARLQIGLDPMRRSRLPTRTTEGSVEPDADPNAMEITDDGEVIIDQGFQVCEETMFRRADCSMKALPIVGGLVAGAVILGMLARG